MREFHAKCVKITRLLSGTPTRIEDLLGFSQRMGVAQDMRLVFVVFRFSVPAVWVLVLV